MDLVNWMIAPFAALYEGISPDPKKEHILPILFREHMLVYSGVGGRRGVAKAGWNPGPSGCAGADHRPLGPLLMKIVSTTSKQRIWVYNAPVFGVKKEIPVRLDQWRGVT